MSAASLTRSRLLATAAAILFAAILLVLPSALNFISGAEDPTVPSNLTIADDASQEDLAPSRRTLPETASQPPARDPQSHNSSLSKLASGSGQTLDQRLADAIQREIHEQEPDAEDLVAYLLRDLYYGDFVAFGTEGPAGTTGGAGGIAASGSAFRGGGIGGGGFFAGSGQGGTDAPINDGSGLSAFNEIRGLAGPPSSGGDVVFTPKADGGELVAPSEIELSLIDPATQKGLPTGKFDQGPLPESPTSVPEPATLVLTGLGLCGLMGKAWAGRKRSVY